MLIIKSNDTFTSLNLDRLWRTTFRLNISPTGGFMNERDIRLYTDIANFLGNILGPDYEIILYDLNHILLIINGDISGLTKGAPISNVMKNILHKKNSDGKKWTTHYRALSGNGKILRCSTLYIKNETGKTVGAININFDDNRYRELSSMVFSLCHPDAYVSNNISIEIKGNEQELLSENISSAVDDILKRIDIRLPLNKLSQSEKLYIIRQLYQKGIFSMKGALKAVGAKLSCSSASMYRYLNIIKKEQNNFSSFQKE